MKKETKKKNNVFGFCVSTLQSILLLYVTIAFVFTFVLAWSAHSESVVIQYLVTGKPALDFLTHSEAAHMADVRVLLGQGMRLAAWSALVLVVSAIALSPTQRTYRVSFYLSLAFIILLIPFPWTFTWLHNVFFPQGNWQFPADSWLITHFSEAFFAIIAFVWLGLTTGFLYVLASANDKKSAS